MISLPPKVFFDTQVIIDAERGSIPSDDWSRVASYLRNTTRYCISPLTAGELIYALANGDSRYFKQHQRRLRILLSPGENAEVFDFITYFFAAQFGLSISRPDHLEDDFLGTINLILEASSKDALLQGFRRSGENAHQTARVRIDRFANEHFQTMQKYVEFMESRKQAGTLEALPREWASLLLKLYGVPEGDLDPLEIAERLSATYEFEMAVNNLMKSDKFSVTKNKSDHLDGQQLCYLCDPSVVFVTNDSDFKNRTKKSRQSSRIKSFSEIVALATAKSPLM